MKVLHVISNNDYGGGATYVLNICKAPACKIENYLCCIGQGPLYEMAREKGINSFNMSSGAVVKGEINKIIKSKGIDVINFHGAKSNFLYFFIKRNIKVPAIVTVHSDYRYDFINSRIKHILFTPLSVLGLRSFRYFVCVSRHIKDLLENKKFNGIKTVIENGIEIDKYSSEVDPIELKKQIGAEDGEFIITMVARFHPIKNHETLIQAFELLHKEYPSIKLVLVGDGVQLNQLKVEANKRKLDDNIIFTGFKGNTKDYLYISNISILPSFSEGGSPPLVILESGLVKRPVICSNVGDMQYVINDKLGYLVNPNSVEDIYAKLKAAYLDKESLPDKGLELYNKVIEEYSIETFWDKYSNFYNRVIQSHKK